MPSEFVAAVVLTVVTGLLLALFSHRIPRNLLLGYRIGYTLLSHSVWARVNREAGVILVLIGVATLILETLFPGSAVSKAFYLSSLTIALIALAFRAKRLAEYESLTKPPEGARDEPVVPLKVARVSKAKLIVVALTTATTILVVALAYPSLPSKVAVNFNTEGSPTSLVSKELMLLAILSFISPGVIALGLTMLTVKYPIILYNPWVPVDKLLDIVIDISVLLQAFLLLLVIDILLYNMEGSHIIPIKALLMLQVLLSIFIVARLAIVMALRR